MSANLKNYLENNDFLKDPFLVIHSFSSILKKIPIAFGGSGE